ncbi:MAG: helix-turn-helix domain-containing protein [Ignisphaera sp.]|nr:helix-turn-helix domain-containing protein [Ignisphaera sp.]
MNSEELRHELLRMVEERDVLLRISEACRLLGIGRTTLVTKIKRGEIKAYKVGGKWRIPLSELIKLSEKEEK